MMSHRWKPLEVALALPLLLSAGLATVGARQEDGDLGSRHICPAEAMRNGKCVPNPGKAAPADAQKRQPRYKRVGRLKSTAADCNGRVKAAGRTRPCRPAAPSPAEGDLPLSAQKVGVTVWKVREARRDYEGAGIISRPGPSRPAVRYQAERVEGDPVVAYGEKVRLGIESPRDGYLYVFDRELYDDGSLSAAYMIFPTRRLRNGDNRIRANRPVEFPSLADYPVYFEAKKVGLDAGRRLAGEVLTVVITERPVERLGNFGMNPMQVSEAEMASLENLYAGRGEVFELEDGVGRPYSTAERDAAAEFGARLLTHADPAPQTLYLVEDRRNGGLMVSLALKYERSSDRALLVGVEQYPDPIRPAPGAANDVRRWRRLLVERYGFAPSAVRELTDGQATDANIREAVRGWLVAQTNPGDRVFLFFGGHGAQVPDADGDEPDDRRDEAIVPSDARVALAAPNWVAPTANFITDDDVGQWLAELSGRRVVFVFDSCFTGSGADGGPAGDRAALDGRLLRVREGAESRLARFRGLVHPAAPADASASASIREPFTDEVVNGAVIISAARSRQEAMPVRDAAQAPVGALTYLLTEMLEGDSSIPVSQIEGRLGDGIRRLKSLNRIRPGGNGEYQQPLVEVVGKGGLERQPLFGGPRMAAPAAALYNPASEIKVSLAFDGGQTVFRAGDTATVKVWTNRAGFLYLLVFSEQEVATCLLPRGEGGPVRIQSGVNSFGGFYARGPFGKDVWVALVTDRPLPLGNVKDGRADYPYTWNEIFDLVGIPELQARLKAVARNRGFGNQSGARDWQAASVTVETVAR